MYRRFDDGPPIKLAAYDTTTSDVDLRTAGGMYKPARKIIAATGGTIYLVNESDRQGVEVELAQNVEVTGHFLRMAFGTQATLTSALEPGSYPGSLTADRTMTLRFDESTIFDTQNVVVTVPQATTLKAEVMAAINARMNELFPEPAGHPDRVWASDGGGEEITLTGRARGSAAKVEVVAIDAELATMTGFSATSDTGAQFASPATGLQVSW